MTAYELVEKGFTKIRKPQWNGEAYMELHVTEDKMIGPWCKLHDPVGSAAFTPEPLKLLSLSVGLSDRDWVGVEEKKAGEAQ